MAVNALNDKIKADFDVKADLNKLNSYISEGKKTPLSHIFFSKKLNKRLSQFTKDDVYNSIAYASLNSLKLSNETLQSHYDSHITRQGALVKQTVHSQISKQVFQIQERIKSSKPTPTAQDIMANRTAKEIADYNDFIEYFLSQHIYNTFDNTDSPLKSLNISYETYLASLASTKIANHQDYYNTILAKINAIISTDSGKPVYKDNYEIRKRIIRLHIDVNKHILPIVNELLTLDNKCFIQNYGSVEVNMRPCRLYFVKERNMCDIFEDIYKMSNLQLSYLVDLYAPNWNLYQKPNSQSSFHIYIFSKSFLDIINSVDKSSIFNKDTMDPVIFNRFKSVLTSIYERNDIQDITDDYTKALLKKIINDIYTSTVNYNKKKYNCLALYRIREQKKLNNGKQLCKIEIPELKEIAGENPDKQYEYKVQDYTHTNKPELWGSCFYNLSSTQLDNKSRQRIAQSMKTKYGISPSCDDNVIDNLKCKSGCHIASQNKYMAFDATNFDYTKTNMKLNDNIYISEELVFLKIKLNGNGFNSTVQLQFVKFNKTTKMFDTIQNAYSLNEMVKKRLFTIEIKANTFSLEPNKSTKPVLVCNFFNGVLYDFSTQSISFSLNELTNTQSKGQISKQLKPQRVYMEVRKNILVLSHMSHLVKRCGNYFQYNNDYEHIRDCLNEVKNLLNNSTLSNLRDVLSVYTREKTYQEQIIAGIDAQISAKNQELIQQCQAPGIISLLNTYSSLIAGYDNEIAQARSKYIELNRELQKWEAWRPDWWKPWEWIHKVRMTNDTKRYIWENNQYWDTVLLKRRGASDKIAVINNKCNTIRQQITHYQNNKTHPTNFINNNIAPKIRSVEGSISAYNSQHPDFYYQNIETYEINNLDVVSDILRLNSKLTIDFIWKYCVLMYDNKFLTSNDDCIYIQVN
jgi:hypothetical protein